jgi:uncharacterized membrane protein YfcA
MSLLLFILVCALIGLAAGTLGGLLGVGGGVVMVPAFLRFLGLSAHEAVGTSMAVIVFTALVAALRHYQLGNVNAKVMAIVAVLSMVGGYLGATLSERLPERQLRIAFGLFLLFVAVQMLVRAWRMGPSS